MSQFEYSQTGYASRPAELYEFRYGDGASDILCFTSADHDITIGAVTYTSIAIERGRITDDGNPDDGNALRLSMPRINPLAELYQIQPPEKTVTVKLKAVQLDDPDQQVLTLWSGRVINMAWEYPAAVVACERISTSLKRTGVRARYTRHCRHVHYGPGCNLVRQDYALSGAIDNIVNKLNLSIPAASGQPDGYYTAGILEFQGAMRLVVGHAGNSVSINRPIMGLQVGDLVTLYPGCDRSATTCAAKFNNVDNYGGFDFIPVDGPFDGNNINSIV
jgi:uncharacterized phage protein (TIGR02218 family)